MTSKIPSEHVHLFRSCLTEPVPEGNEQDHLRNRLEDGLKEIRRMLDFFDQEDQFVIPLRVWADNFLYFLTLEDPEVGLKTYIPLLLDTLECSPNKSHTAARLLETWLQNPDVQAVCRSILEQRKTTTALSRFQPPTRRLIRNYSPLRSPHSDILLRGNDGALFFIENQTVNGTSEEHFLQFLQLSNRICKQEKSVDLIYNKMGKTSRAIQEYIFTFLGPSDLRKASAVCQDFFRRCHSKAVFCAVHIPNLQRQHPEVFKTKYTLELDHDVAILNMLVANMLKSKKALDESESSIRVMSFKKDLQNLRAHLGRASKKFTYELLLFRAIDTFLQKPQGT